MFGLSVWELLIILAIVVLIFGVGRLPEVGNGMGKAIREFRKALGGTDLDAKDEEKASADSSAESRKA